MMARSLNAPSIGRIQKRKTNVLQIIIFGLQRAAGPYRWVKLSRAGHRLPWPLYLQHRSRMRPATATVQGQEQP